MTATIYDAPTVARPESNDRKLKRALRAALQCVLAGGSPDDAIDAVEDVDPHLVSPKFIKLGDE
jgi:hypothetical protein